MSCNLGYWLHMMTS